MEVKIGVHNATRELLVESDKPAKDVEAAVRKALADPHGLLELTDERGRQYFVRVEHLTYVEIGEPIERRVGFGTL